MTLRPLQRALLSSVCHEERAKVGIFIQEEALPHVRLQVNLSASKIMRNTFPLFINRVDGEPGSKVRKLHVRQISLT